MRESAGSPEAARAAVIYVVRRGWHVDLGFEVRDLSPALSRLEPSFPGAQYLLFGFGDRRYIEGAQAPPLRLIQALWPGAGLLLLTGLRVSPADAFGVGNVVKMRVTPAQAAAIQAFVVASFVHPAGHGDAGEFATPALGPYRGSLYYSAAARYSGWHTCNTWAAEGLETARLPVRSRGVVFAGQLWAQIAPR